MRRNASSVLAWVVMASVGCVEEPPEEQGSAFDSGGLTSGALPCPTCLLDAGASQDGGQFAPQCNALDPGSCANYPNCAPIVGLAYDSVRYCRGETQLPVACQSREVECGFGLVRVIDPVGQRWLLPNRCIPAGYKDAPMEIHPINWIEDYTVCPSAALQTRCGQLDERACAANETCFAQMGTQLNERRSCKQGSPRFVACVQNTTCNRVLTYARDPSGNSWELIGSCLPSGFTSIATSNASNQNAWPSCAF